MESVIGFSNKSWDISNVDDRRDLSLALNKMSLIELRTIYNQLTYLVSKHPVGHQRRKDEWKIAIRAMVNRYKYSNAA